MLKLMNIFTNLCCTNLAFYIQGKLETLICLQTNIIETMSFENQQDIMSL